jgi:hypothetical protein
VAGSALLTAVAHAQPPSDGQPAPPAPSAPEHAPIPEPPVGISASASPAGFTFDANNWKLTLYGFAELDAIHDTTESFNESTGNAPIARSAYRPEDVGTPLPELMPNNYPGNHGRTTFSARNSRLGFKIRAPEYQGIRASGVIEMDFFSNNAPTVSESGLLGNGSLRTRHAYLKLETDYVNVLAGQTYALFGWQAAFYPSTVALFPIPAQNFGKPAQLIVSHSFKTAPVSVDVAVAASRPGQRDSQLPDGVAGVRAMLNNWKGTHTPGSLGTTEDPLSVGVSGIARRFEVNEFAAIPVNSNKTKGWGFSVDAFVPVIPAASLEKRGNALTLTGTFVTGTGIGDLMGGNLNGNLALPYPPNPEMLPIPPPYVPNIDPGIVAYDDSGILHTINWRTYMVGLQYYLPPSGRVFVTANYSRARSNNIRSLVPDCAILTPQPPCLNRGNTYWRTEYFDANLFVDITEAARAGVSYQFIKQYFADDGQDKNTRLEMAMYFAF